MERTEYGEYISPKTAFGAKELFYKTIRKHFISDVTGIPMGEIRFARMGNPYLRKRYRDMIHTTNAGINMAVGEVKKMSMSERIRAGYVAHLKEVRDRNAREEYVKQQP